MTEDVESLRQEFRYLGLEDHSSKKPANIANLATNQPHNRYMDIGENIRI